MAVKGKRAKKNANQYSDLSTLKLSLIHISEPTRP